jgi:hypothetical protein
VATLTLAVAGAPLVYDGCLMTCQSVAAAAQTAGAEHPCHHVAGGLGVLQRLSNQARPCNHDHGQAASLSDNVRPDDQGRTMPVAPTYVAVTTATLVLDQRVESPPPDLSLLEPSTSLPLPLRI